MNYRNVGSLSGQDFLVQRWGLGQGKGPGGLAFKDLDMFRALEIGNRLVYSTITLLKHCVNP